MKEIDIEYIIVGAGLSGLTSANMLENKGETNFLILESRARVGGRILTTNGIDLGATWFQEDHRYLKEMMNNLELDKFNQYDEGKSVLVYNSMEPAHHFEKDTSLPSAYRIAGGSTTLIHSLSQKLKEKIRTNTVVSEIVETEEGISVITNHAIYKAKKAIVTLPPRMASFISYSPQLPENTIKIMRNTHTWMSNAIKVGLNFKTPFWKEKGLSGTIISQVSVVTELYDHTNAEENHFSLMGFVSESLRDASPEERKARVLGYLEEHLGSEVLDYIAYEEKDWSKDENTSKGELTSRYTSLQYGNKEFQKFHLNGKLLFSGTETSAVNGGYMDGAIYSGLNAAQRLLETKSVTTCHQA